MAAEDEENTAVFSFLYGKEDLRECLIHTEKELRDTINSALAEKFGLDWETNLSVGFDLEQQQDLQNRQNIEAKRIHSQNKAERLIDYTYIQDLEGLIKKHWNQVFCNIFPWSLHNVEYMFDILLNYRDVLMHGRDENIPSYKKYLCLGVCGEILNAISYWCLGFRRRGDISSYKCNMFFCLSKDDPDCESKTRELTEHWIDTITKLSIKPKEKIEDDGRYEKWLIQLSEGKIRLTIDKRLNVRTELITGHELKYYCGIDITLETESVEALDKVIVNGRHPYRAIEMVVTGRFDMKRIKLNAEHMGRHIHVSAGRSMAKGSSISCIRFVIFEGYGDIHPVPDFYIEAHVQEGSNESGSSIALVYQGGLINNGFFQAHKVLLPNTALSILYNKVKGPDVRQLVSMALSLPSTI
jgi:hypothetical protein